MKKKIVIPIATAVLGLSTFAFAPSASAATYDGQNPA